MRRAFMPRKRPTFHSPNLRMMFSFNQKRPVLLLLLWTILWQGQFLFAQQTNSASNPTKEQDLRRTVSRALNSLGVFYYEKQESAKAIETLEQALEYDPGNADVRTNLAMMYLEQQHFEKVLEQLDSVSGHEQDQRSLTALAVSTFALGKYDQAVLFYKKLVEQQPADPVLRLTLAVTLQLSGQSEESEKILKQLPNDITTQAQFHVILADAYRFRAKGPEAVAEYEKALSLAPVLPEVNYRLGVMQ